MKHVRLELEQKDHEILRLLAGTRGNTMIGYVRKLVMREIRRFRSSQKEKDNRRHFGRPVPQ